MGINFPYSYYPSLFLPSHALSIQVLGLILSLSHHFFFISCFFHLLLLLLLLLLCKTDSTWYRSFTCSICHLLQGVTAAAIHENIYMQTLWTLPLQVALSCSPTNATLFVPSHSHRCLFLPLALTSSTCSTTVCMSCATKKRNSIAR